MDAVFAEASRLDGYAGAWMDQSRNTSKVEVDMNDPLLVTVNVAVTGDLAAAEQSLRETWGGALCVFRAEHTEAELQRISEALRALPGMRGSGSGVDRIDVDLVWDDGSLQAWADEKYGDGLVRITSILRPAS